MRVHRVPELVGQRAHGVDVVVVAHEDERARVRDPRREGPHALAFVRVDVDPALFERAFAEDRYVLVSERRHSGGDPIDSLLVGHVEPEVLKRCPGVVRLQRLHPEDLSSEPPVAMPRADVVAKRLNDVVKDVERNECRFEGGM